MSRMAEQQRTVVGTLKALGYSNQEIFLHFIQFGLLIGIAGGLLGILIGYSLAGAMTAQYRNFFEFPSLINQMYPRVILLGMLISIFFAVLGTFRGVRSVVRLSPAEAMRPKPPLRARRILLEKIHAFWNALDFRWQLVLRDIFRNRTRTLGGLLSATVGAMLLLVTFSMYDSAFALLNFQYDKLLLSDIDLSFKDDHDFAALFESQQLTGVDYGRTPVFTSAARLKTGSTKRRLASPASRGPPQLTIPRDTAGNRVNVPETGILVTRKLADILKIQAGDSLEMIPVTGDRVARQVPVMENHRQLPGPHRLCRLRLSESTDGGITDPDQRAVENQSSPGDHPSDLSAGQTDSRHSVGYFHSRSERETQRSPRGSDDCDDCGSSSYFPA